MADVKAERIKGTGSDTVTVACKMPNGLKLRVHNMVDIDVQVMGGGVKIGKQAQWTGEEYVVRGPAIEFGMQHPFPVHGGYALTPGIPAEFWARWLEENKNAPYVKNQMIMAADRSDDIVAKALENHSRRSGLEPLRTDGDLRMPRNVKQSDVSKAA